jgi:hypothetical protein
VRTRTFKYKRIARHRKSPKCRKEGVFLVSLEAENSFLREDQQWEKCCTPFADQFLIQHGGHSDIPQHIKKRKQEIAAETKSSSKKVTSYFTKENYN